MGQNGGRELVVPTARDAVLALPSPTLYALEQAGEIAREILDGRIIEWTEHGWTQKKIADEVGCSRQAVSKRQARLGVASRDPRRFNSLSNPVAQNGTSPDLVVDEPEAVEDAEVMPEGQMEFDERTDQERLDDLPDDLAGRVQAGALPLDEAESVADEREQRIQVWVSELRRAIKVLTGLAGHPVPAGLIDKLDADERATLTLLLDGVPAEEENGHGR